MYSEGSEQVVRALVADGQPAIIERFCRVLLGGTGARVNSPLLAGLNVLWYRSSRSISPRLELELLTCHRGPDAAEAVRRLRAQGRPVHLLFVDAAQDGQQDGVALAAQIRSIDPDTQVILLAGQWAVPLDEIARQVPPPERLFFLREPFEHEEVQQLTITLSAKWRAEQQLRDYQQELERRVQERTAALERSRLELMLRLAKAGEYRDEETGHHIVRVGEYTRLLAEALELDAEMVQLVSLTSPLHDIGKIGVPDRILLKPGRLDPEERRIVERHCEIGFRILLREPKGIRVLLGNLALDLPTVLDNPMAETASLIAHCHHERWDGNGYPRGLSGEAIPLAARLVALADVYDALRSERPYKAAFPPEKAHAILLEGRGTQFDPAVVAAYERVADSFHGVWDDLSRGLESTADGWRPELEKRTNSRW